MDMSNYTNKTTYLGALLFACGVAKSFNPEWVAFFDMSADVLSMWGLTLIFGRDALRKLSP